MTEEISHRVDYKFELDGDQLKVSLADQNKVIELDTKLKRQIAESACYFNSIKAPYLDVDQIDIDQVGVMVWDKNWQNLLTAHNENREIEAKVIGFVDGGLVVDAGVRAWAPGRNFSKFGVYKKSNVLGKSYNFKVSRIFDHKGSAVLTRDHIFETEFKENQKKLFNSAGAKNSRVEAEILKHDRNGVLLQDNKGLVINVNYKELTYSWVQSFRESFPPGETLTVKLLELDEKNFIARASAKDAGSWKWTQKDFPLKTEKKYQAKVEGKTENGYHLSLTDIDEPIGAYLHKREMSWSDENQPELEIGTELEVTISRIDFEKKSVWASVRMGDTSSFETYLKAQKEGKEISAKFEKEIDAGFIFKFEDGMDGFLSRYKLGWHSLVDKTLKAEPGDEINLKVDHVDLSRGRIYLSLCQYENPYEQLKDVDFDTLILHGHLEEIDGDWLFYCPELDIYAELDTGDLKDSAKVKKMQELSKSNFDVMIDRYDRKTRVVTTSIKKYQKNFEKIALKGYQHSQAELTQSLILDDKK